MAALIQRKGSDIWYVDFYARRGVLHLAEWCLCGGEENPRERNTDLYYFTDRRIR